MSYMKRHSLYPISDLIARVGVLRVIQIKHFVFSHQSDDLEPEKESAPLDVLRSLYEISTL